MLEIAKLRILDFFLCFPAELERVQLPQEHSEAKKIARAAKNPYRGPISAARTFRELEPIQSAAVRMLAFTGIISITEIENGRIVRTGKEIPVELQGIASDDFDFSSPLEQYILSKMAEMPLSGVGGLKHRTGLMEYRYDFI